MLPLVFAIRLALPLAEPAPLPPPKPVRIYESASLHVGLRPHAYADGAEIAGAITLQVTCRVPW